MNRLTSAVLIVFSLTACSGSDTEVTAQPGKNKSDENKDFLFKDMKDSMDEARGVKDLMDKHHEKQKQDLNKL